jgi:hypothetical protein
MGVLDEFGRAVAKEKEGPPHEHRSLHSNEGSQHHYHPANNINNHHGTHLAPGNRPQPPPGPLHAPRYHQPRHDSASPRKPHPHGTNNKPPPPHTKEPHHQHHSSAPPPAQHQHPSKTYQEEPLLCQFLYDEKHKQQQQQQDNSDTTNDTVDQSTTTTTTPTTLSYDEYRNNYCLFYVRAFFNHHLDTSWFRARYSALEIKRGVLQERARAAREALALRQHVQGMLNNSSGADLQRLVSHDNKNSLHAMSCVPCSLVCLEVPSFVTDDQVRLAMNYPVEIYNTTTASTSNTSANISTFQNERNVLVVYDSQKARDDVWLSVHRHGRVVDMECGDPYCRLDEYVSGALARKCTVSVQLPPPPRRTTLTAALSAVRATDRDAAVTIAAALDAKKEIPKESCFKSLLDELKLNDTTDATNTDAATSTSNTQVVLDLAVAYLRRVHLFSFYNGCCMAANAADVIAGKHPASTIHLRSSTSVSATEEQQPAVAVQKDLLVQRHDDSIARALDDLQNNGNTAHTVIVDEETDRIADAIQQAEDVVREKWLDDHVVLEGGRARCAFHFCHKLFKDADFLRKHLTKKHGEYLKAEQAKCHDEYMKRAWDAEEHRPVPNILVYCGTKFGLVETRIVGVEPDCKDPEPELWKRDDELRRREDEQKQKRDEQRQQQQQQSRKDDGKIRVKAFVDVDDMKEEKVELLFENVIVPVAVKKSKKKRKLL